MPRKKPKAPSRPFFRRNEELERILSEATAPELAAMSATVPPATDRRDWVEREEDAFIASRPHLNSLAQDGYRENVVLMYERIRAKRAEDALSRDAFNAKLADRSDNLLSIIDLLKRSNAFREDEGGTGSPETTFCPVELYVFYLNHRATAADELLAAEFQSAESVDRMAKLADKCRALAFDLRWIARLAECSPEDHPMPDDLRGAILRAGGMREPELHKGWLETFAEWVNEAAARLERAPGGYHRTKETAFQIDWHIEATNRTGGDSDVVDEVGRRLFLIAFPSARKRYIIPENYRRVVKRKINALTAPKGGRTGSGH